MYVLWHSIERPLARQQLQHDHREAHMKTIFKITITAIATTTTITATGNDNRIWSGWMDDRPAGRRAGEQASRRLLGSSRSISAAWERVSERATGAHTYIVVLVVAAAGVGDSERWATTSHECTHSLSNTGWRTDRQTKAETFTVLIHTHTPLQTHTYVFIYLFRSARLPVHLLYFFFFIFYFTTRTTIIIISSKRQ